MPLIFWTPLSVSYLIEAIFASIVAGYFLHCFLVARRAGEPLRPAIILMITFGSAAVALVTQLLGVSLRPDLAMIVLPWASPLGSLAMAGYILNAFYFKRTTAKTRIIELFLLICFGALVLFETVIAAQRAVLLQSGIVEFRDHWLRVPFAIGFLLPPLLFANRFNSNLAAERNCSPWRAAGATVTSLFLPGIRLSRDFAALRAFFYATLMPMLLGVTLLLRSIDIIDWNLALLVTNWMVLFTFALFALAYLNYVPEHSSFQLKLVGATLIAVLLILSGLSWLIGSVNIDTYVSRHSLRDNTSIQFDPLPNNAYRAANVPARFDTDFGTPVDAADTSVSLPFDFPFYGKAYSKLFVHSGGMVGFESLPRWQDLQSRFGPQPAVFLVATDLRVASERPDDGPQPMFASGLYWKAGPGIATITWNRLVSNFHPQDHYTFQLKLYADGRLDMVFADMPDNPQPDLTENQAMPIATGIVPAFAGRTVAYSQFSTALPVAGERQQGIIDFRQLDFSAYLDKIYAPIAVFVVVSSLLVLLVFPRFFRVNLDQPLQQLISGVQQIMSGKLGVSIDVLHRDEIGYLATSFNEMARVQGDLIQNLEKKVAERSAEAADLAARNARLEERHHLSRELHDAVSQTLFSANIIADILPDLWDQDRERAYKATDEIRRLNKDALQEMRLLLQELRPTRYSAFRFSELLAELAANIERNFQISILLQIEGDATLPEAVQHAFYRIAQECMTNAAKHADAKEITVVFDGMPRQAMLTVSDNGRGFDRAAVGPGRFGLQILEERMQALGGTLEVASTIGRGTTVTAIWMQADTSH